MDRNFNRIVNSYADMLFRLAMHYTSNRSDGEDIVQQTFLKLIEKEPHFKDEEHEKAWLIRVCINLCKDILKSKNSHNLPLNTDVIKEIPQSSYIIDTVRTLPPKQKTAIYLFYYEKLSVKEIAVVMKLPQNTVLSHLNRGRKTLETLLKEDL